MDSAEPAAPLILEYDRAEARRQSWLWVSVGVLFAIPGVASIVLPFAWNEYPLSVAIDYSREIAAGSSTHDWPLAALAAPFFLAIPILAWRVRALIHPCVSAPERAIAIILAGLGAVLTIVLDVMIFLEAPRELAAAVACGSSVAVLVVGAIIVFRRRLRADAALLAMMAAYSGNAVLAMLAFPESPGLGWYATLAAVILHAIQVAAAMIRRADL